MNKLNWYPYTIEKSIMEPYEPKLLEKLGGKRKDENNMVIFDGIYRAYTHVASPQPSVENAWHAIKSTFKKLYDLDDLGDYAAVELYTFGDGHTVALLNYTTQYEIVAHENAIPELHKQLNK